MLVKDLHCLSEPRAIHQAARVPSESVQGCVAARRELELTDAALLCHVYGDRVCGKGM